jgi:hypothetical protein
MWLSPLDACAYRELLAIVFGEKPIHGGDQYECCFNWILLRFPRAYEESRWKFFVSPVISTTRSRRRVGGVYRPLNTASTHVGKSSRSPLHRAAAFHFIHFIEAALNAGLTSLKEYSIITTL